MLVVSIVLMISTCAGEGKKDSTEEKPVVNILYPNWAEGIAFTYLEKAALEDNGFEVELINLEPGLIYGELSKENSKGDVFLDAWLPHTHEVYREDYGDDLVKPGESFSEGTTGLAVPTYVDINSITQLNEYKKKFDNEIIGIGAGAGIHGNTEKAIEEYNLDYQQITSSGPAMVASLEKAIRMKSYFGIAYLKLS